MRNTLESPATIAPKWMPRCAEVQKGSRPIDMCQEMSQYKPTDVAVTATTEAQGRGLQWNIIRIHYGLSCFRPNRLKLLLRALLGFIRGCFRSRRSLV